MSQEEYKKEELNLRHMFLLLDRKRKVAFKFFFQKSAALHLKHMFIFIELT